MPKKSPCLICGYRYPLDIGTAEMPQRWCGRCGAFHGPYGGADLPEITANVAAALGVKIVWRGKRRVRQK